jgi:hypothetical protein
MKTFYRKSLCGILVLFLSSSVALCGEQTLQISTFQQDVTPPIGSPLCLGLIKPAVETDDPLSARGVVLFNDKLPIVLCVIDWVIISNDSHDQWRKELAEAAGTTIDRVTVHNIHNHDSPGCDFSAEALLVQQGLGGKLCNAEFQKAAVTRTAAALKKSLQHKLDVTHIGLGTGVVEKVASNRRVLGPDGKVKHVRYSSSRNPEAIAAPEGVIDPKVRLICFYQNEKPLISITHYATHPQSYYGKGSVSADFVGLAREIREQKIPDVAHIHFDGAGGNVAAGKYNNGEPQVRPVLAKRLAAGMKAAWDNQKKHAVTAADVSWTFQPVALPLRDTVVEEKLVKVLENEKASLGDRMRAARDLAFCKRVQAGRKININCLKLGPARVLYLPGELFVEYQLAAQKMRPNDFVAMAAYGDCGPGYIGTKIAYSQGGYETSKVSRTAPEVEQVLIDVIQKLLKD